MTADSAATAPPGRSPGRCSGRRPTCRRSRRRGSRPTRDRTSSASARCCTNCCRAGASSNATPLLDTLNAVVRDEPPPLDSPAAEIVKRCLAKQPSHRFQSMADVKAALQHLRIDEAGPVRAAPSIAVLPFANMSRDADDEYFSDGLAEEIINALAQVPGLKVIARTSAFAFKGQERGHPPDRRDAWRDQHAGRERAPRRQPHPRDGAAHSRRRRHAPVVAALRPRDVGHLCGPGRDCRGDCRTR